MSLPSVPRVVESVAVSALVAVALAEVSTAPERTGWLAVHVAAVLVLGAAVALRRRLGVAAPVLGAAAGVFQCAVGFVGSAGELVLFLVLVATAAALPTLPARAIGLGALSVAEVVVLSSDPSTPTLVAALPSLVLFAAAAAAGTAVRRRVWAAESLAVEAETAYEQALAGERTRIARELHDVVTHSLSVIVIQAGAARLDAPAGRTGPLDGIELTARSALDEMRRLLGVLRGEEEPDLSPQPGLDQLPHLVGALRESGLHVEVLTTGPAQPLPPGLDLAAYRLVQEATTNVLRHAGARQVVVRLDWTVERLVLQVQDDGTGPPVRTVPGRGLVGMRERTVLYGGRFEAGRRPEGGFAVRAELPLLEARAQVGR